MGVIYQMANDTDPQSPNQLTAGIYPFHAIHTKRHEIPVVACLATPRHTNEEQTMTESAATRAHLYGGKPPMLLPPAADVARQHELEAEMNALGTERFHKVMEEAREGDRQSATGYGKTLLAGAITKVSAGITTWIKKQTGARTKATALRFLYKLNPDVVAFLAAKGVIDGITRRRRVQSIAVRIGRAFEDEARFQAFAKSTHTKPDGTTEPMDAYVFKLVQNLNGQTTDYRHKRTVMNHCMVKMGITWDSWSEDDVYQLGSTLIDIVISTTGVAEMVMDSVKRKQRELYLVATAETKKWIDAKVGWDEVMCPLYQPMVVPPRDWTTPTQGGYLSDWGDASKFVKTRNKAYLEELHSADLALVYSSVNAIQRTPWKVNQDILGVLTETWRNTHHEIGALPPREDMEKPTKPIDIKTNLEARRDWRRAASKVIRQNLKVASKRLLIMSTMRTAEKFKDEPAIYFPHNVDFRGRLYSIPSGLTPQGNDIAKSLLTFAVGKPLDTQLAADWLAIHGANLWGHDKVSLEDRVAWVEENESRILDSANAPLDYLWWAEADKPWQFLAFCLEWAGYRREGLTFVSHIPVALDGSCNGLQHFSAMLRDPVGGKAVNLTPSDKPSDIYQTVADKTIEKLKKMINPYARLWLTFGITRKLTKRPVMVVPYGGTRHSCKDYIIAYVKETLAGQPGPFGDEKETFKACLFLSEVVWEAIGETVIAARDAMGWLQKVSQIVSQEEKPINWTSPSGFKVLQAYPNTALRRVKTMISGRIVKMYLSEELPTIDKREQAQGISPNFVHSLDAAALTYTVDAAVSCGIDSFAMIHDSYGTLAADTDTLRECLRQAFCQMYQFDVLQSFATEVQAGLPKGVELPPLPAKGSLDINLVLKSDFFFA